MTTQAEQDAERLTRGKAEAKQATIDERFWLFHLEHPIVYELLVRRCREWRAKHPDRRVGIRMLWEVLRWDTWMRGLPDDDQAFKLNDHYQSRYARLIMRQEADLDAIFEIRTLRAP